MYSGRPTLGTEGFPHTYDLGLKGLALTITDRDIEGKPVPGIACSTHKYDPGAEGLPLTISA